jgi:hypothetical protein
MAPPSMESIFLILSGVILAAGVLYWFWSHIQLTQKKVQLLENAVFELRGLLVPTPAESSVESAPPRPEEDWEPPAESQKSTPLEALETLDLDLESTVTPPERVVSDDLQPGGGASVGDLISEKKDDSFRELFIQHDPPSPVKESTPESLEAMPVRELRRLAEQRGLTGVSDMRKKELLSLLRQQISTPSVTIEREDLADLEQDNSTA